MPKEALGDRVAYAAKQLHRMGMHRTCEFTINHRRRLLLSQWKITLQELLGTLHPQVRKVFPAHERNPAHAIIQQMLDHVVSRMRKRLPHTNVQVSAGVVTPPDYVLPSEQSFDPALLRFRHELYESLGKAHLTDKEIELYDVAVLTPALLAQVHRAVYGDSSDPNDSGVAQGRDLLERSHLLHRVVLRPVDREAKWSDSVRTCLRKISSLNLLTTILASVSVDDALSEAQS